MQSYICEDVGFSDEFIKRLVSKIVFFSNFCLSFSLNLYILCKTSCYVMLDVLLYLFQKCSDDISGRSGLQVRLGKGCSTSLNSGVCVAHVSCAWIT